MTFTKIGFSIAHVQKDIFYIATAQFNFVMSFYVTFAIHTIQIIAINSLESSSLEILGDAIRNDIEKLTSSILVAEKHALSLVLYIPIFSIQSKYVGTLKYLIKEHARLQFLEFLPALLPHFHVITKIICPVCQFIPFCSFN